MYKVVTIHTRSTYWTNKESQEELIVDSDDLAHEMEKVSNELNDQGFEVISIVPVTSGSISNGNGYYQTESIIITGKKKK
jgi:predicted CoA-binding protein